MPDSPNDDSTHSPASPLTAEQAAAIQAAKPLAPRPRPAFTRRAKPVAQATVIDLQAIPEAVPLDDIPEGIPLGELRNSPPATKIADRQTRVPGNRPVRPKSSPQNRVVEAGQPAVEVERIPIDRSKFADFERYEKGEISVRPLEKLPGVESRQVQRLERPKFLDGELPRRVERGVQYPMPGRVIFTAITLLFFKLSLWLTIIGLTAVALIEPDNLAYALWLPGSLLLFGLLFVLSANRTRCRICSCHMFYNRRCFKHQKAHRLFGFGHAGSAALHALLFRWLRCMYCGTAIRLRQPKPESDSEEVEINRPIESRQAEYDKSLIKPRAPK